MRKKIFFALAALLIFLKLSFAPESRADLNGNDDSCRLVNKTYNAIFCEDKGTLSFNWDIVSASDAIISGITEQNFAKDLIRTVIAWASPEINNEPDIEIHDSDNNPIEYSCEIKEASVGDGQIPYPYHDGSTYLKWYYIDFNNDDYADLRIGWYETYDRSSFSSISKGFNFSFFGSEELKMPEGCFIGAVLSLVD